MEHGLTRIWFRILPVSSGFTQIHSVKASKASCRKLGLWKSLTAISNQATEVPQFSKKGEQRTIRSNMFPGMFHQKPDKDEALKQLRAHLAMVGAWVAVIRITPYVLQYFQEEELKFDL